MPAPSVLRPETKVHWTRSRARAAAAPPNPPPEIDPVGSAPTTIPILPLATSDNIPAPSSPQSIYMFEPRATASNARVSDGKLQDDAATKAFRQSFLQELGGRACVVDDVWAPSLYHDTVPPQDLIDDFISSPASGYVRGRWASIPRRSRGEAELSRAVPRVVSLIVKHFVVGSPPGTSRTISDNLSVGFKNPSYASVCPAISVVATGSSFEKPLPNDDYIKGIGFSNLASAIDVMLDNAEWNETKQVSQGALYARQVFVRQANRNFFRTLVVTESRVRLIHYDRSGVCMTPFTNIHDDPHTFIRLVVGLSSIDEAVLGLDTSFQWVLDDTSGRRVSGTLAALDADGSVIRYQLRGEDRPFARLDIIGRGTTCWRATHPETGKSVLVKEAWRPDAKRSEAEFLSAARGVGGVVQMVSSQDNLLSTRSLRPAAFEAVKFKSRVKSRVVMERYGLSIDNYTSRNQAIGALRDALIGYYELLKRSILHRDISTRNILLGPPDAPPGMRGTLIDFDMAVWLALEIPEQMTEFPVGTRRFQSVSVNRFQEVPMPPPHDPLDDLESFFWVLIFLVVGYTEPGVQHPHFDSLFHRFDDKNPKVAGICKLGFVCDGITHVSSWWGESCQALVRGFLAVIFEINQQKSQIRRTGTLTPEVKFKRLVEFGKDYQKYYERVLKLFEDALVEIEEQDKDVLAPAPASATPPANSPAVSTPRSPAQAVAPTTPPTPAQPTAVDTKWRLEDNVASPPPAKRLCEDQEAPNPTICDQEEASKPQPRRSSRRIASKQS